MDEITSRVGDAAIPSEPLRFRAFETDPLKHRVLILGQDPYPNVLHATGLAFSVPISTSPLPKSLQNIFQELHADIGNPVRTKGDLGDWEKQGIWLLNRSLSTDLGNSNSHEKSGWQDFTAAAIEHVRGLGNLQVAVLWGNAARAMAPALPNVNLIESAHPSPLSAYRGFFGSKPFSKVNRYLLAANQTSIDWG